MNIVTSDRAREMAMDFNKTIQQRVDELLKADCSNYCNLGSDSTESERILVRGTSRYLPANKFNRRRNWKIIAK